MAVSPCGAAGLSAPGQVAEGLSNALVHAPIPRQRTEEETAADWAWLQKHKAVTHNRAQTSKGVLKLMFAKDNIQIVGRIV